MTNSVDFDALARKTNESGGAMDALNNLFGATFALEKWHFIARGELPNVSPYIAANAEYADGQQMVRAFTDTDRLLRFAKENNLTRPDGNASILSVPTANIIDYLEQFIPYGVHGIWFNSDTGSDGFFIPIKQLRPVKEHLAKINWQSSSLPPTATQTPSAAVETPVINAPNPALETLLIVVKDGLMLPSDFISQATYSCNFYCRVPPHWTEGGKIKETYLERIYQQVYGVNWRSGNDDGSRYVVLDSFSEVIAPDVVKTTSWSKTENTPDMKFWYYIANEAGEIKNVTAEEFQKDVDASFAVS